VTAVLTDLSQIWNVGHIPDNEDLKTKFDDQ